MINFNNNYARTDKLAITTSLTIVMGKDNCDDDRNLTDVDGEGALLRWPA